MWNWLAKMAFPDWIDVIPEQRFYWTDSDVNLMRNSRAGKPERMYFGIDPTGGPSVYWVVGGPDRFWIVE